MWICGYVRRPRRPHDVIGDQVEYAALAAPLGVRGGGEDGEDGEPSDTAVDTAVAPTAVAPTTFEFAIALSHGLKNTTIAKKLAKLPGDPELLLQVCDSYSQLVRGDILTNRSMTWRSESSCPRRGRGVMARCCIPFKLNCLSQST